ncbi:hypothetical protein CROQUDRAFT_650113 [Cronartium quercuum f. sp. fusiforme G11]|uniref:Uncharacterized protein n=1 Tax=Cronartium quercuum f. sp. fusiforme G11 TaxID=708437 RepID=A0A9P6NXC8_9BASI|nr:hypothetical protein CROQUDRAFT_650113 [Cronartium quercuum f. sp. fusiforme G11]
MLRSLGPVEVPKLFTPFHKNDEMLKILKNREASSVVPESTPSSSSSPVAPFGISPANRSNQLPPNRLTVSTLCDLLELRKSQPVSSLAYQSQTREILRDSTIKLEALESVFGHVNTISVQLVKNPDPQKHEPMKLAVWTDPAKA